eukprot:2302612-Rhodomonas_salina.2
MHAALRGRCCPELRGLAHQRGPATAAAPLWLGPRVIPLSAEHVEVAVDARYDEADGEHAEQEGGEHSAQQPVLQGLTTWIALNDEAGETEHGSREVDAAAHHVDLLVVERQHAQVQIADRDAQQEEQHSARHRGDERSEIHEQECCHFEERPQRLQSTCRMHSMSACTTRLSAHWSTSASEHVRRTCALRERMSAQRIDGEVQEGREKREADVGACDQDGGDAERHLWDVPWVARPCTAMQGR